MNAYMHPDAQYLHDFIIRTRAYDKKGLGELLPEGRRLKMRG